jgi:endonuclease/exonuclease/phosphatase family metal-dependent hydrolase
MKRLLSSVALVLLGLALAPATGADAAAFPASPAGIHVISTTHTSFTVGLNASKNAGSYRLYVSRTKSDVYVANMKAGKHTSGLHLYSATKPRLTAGAFSYTTAPYYYRVVAVAGANRAYSADFYSVGLKPSTPTSLHVVSRYLLWSSGGATGFTVQQATNSAMTQGVVNHTVRGSAHQYTPYGLRGGITYWFRVHATTQRTASAWTPAVSMQVGTREQITKVMTYNILITTSDGTVEDGHKIASWVPGRRDAAAALIKAVNPDVIGVQEGNNWVGPSGDHLRQVDSLNDAIDGGRTYTIAASEVRCCGAGYTVRTGDYVLYKPSVFTAYAPGGHFAIGQSPAPTRYAAYQPLENKATGARFLFVSTHLVAGGPSADKTRENEATALLSGVSAVERQLPQSVPVVYAGDFNSNPVAKQHPLDGPGIVMRNAHIADARDVSPTRTNEKYDSMNEYGRTPPPYSIFIDYVYAGPGVSVSAWAQALHLSAGRFVGTIPSDHNPVYAVVRYAY